jgi:molybdenum cofactor cytidylyltransferase
VLCGKAETDTVTPIDAARVLAHENGQRKGVPANARFAVLLNKADDEARRNIALEIAAELGRYHVERVVIAALNRN